MEQRFHCDITHAQDRAEVRVRGDLDLATASTLESQVLAALALPIAHLSLDLQSLGFMDSSGIRALLGARRAAHEASVAFDIVEVAPQPRKVLELTGLTEIFGLQPLATAAKATGADES